MLQHELPPFDSAADEVGEYHAINGLAIAGFLLGMAAPVALLDPLMCVVPWAGVLVNSMALRRIAGRWPELAGRNVALAGLMLSIVFAVAAPIDTFIHQRMMRAEARQFAELWFDAIREGQPHKAHQLTVDPRLRRPLNDRLVEAYREEARWRAELKTSSLHPPTRALLALGPKAQVRFYETADQDRNEFGDWVRLIYAATYDDREDRKTFFVAVVVQRTVLGDGRANWRFIAVDGGVRPASWRL